MISAKGNWQYFIDQMIKAVKTVTERKVPPRHKDIRETPLEQTNSLIQPELNLNYLMQTVHFLENNRFPFAISCWERENLINPRIKNSAQLDLLFEKYYGKGYTPHLGLRIYKFQKEEVYLSFSFWRDEFPTSEENRIGQKVRKISDMYGSLRFYSPDNLRFIKK